MSAHIRYPALDPSGRSATYSPRILSDLLRDQMGFQGAVISDSMEMEGAKCQTENEARAAVEAIKSGVDILADVGKPEETLALLEMAVEEGSLSEGRVQQAWERVWGLKRVAFGNEAASLTKQLSGQTCLERTTNLIAKVSAKSISVLSEGRGGITFTKDKTLCCVFFASGHRPREHIQTPLESCLRRSFAHVEFIEVSTDSDANSRSVAAELAEKAEQLLVAIVVKPSAWHQYGLSPEQVDLVARLIAHENAVLVSLGSAEALAEFDTDSTRICAYSDVEASQHAIARYLCGEGSRLVP